MITSDILDLLLQNSVLTSCQIRLRAPAGTETSGSLRSFIFTFSCSYDEKDEITWWRLVQLFHKLLFHFYILHRLFIRFEPRGSTRWTLFIVSWPKTKRKAESAAGQRKQEMKCCHFLSQRQQLFRKHYSSFIPGIPGIPGINMSGDIFTLQLFKLFHLRLHTDQARFFVRDKDIEINISNISCDEETVETWWSTMWNKMTSVTTQEHKRRLRNYEPCSSGAC